MEYTVKIKGFFFESKGKLKQQRARLTGNSRLLEQGKKEELIGWLQKHIGKPKG
jgi:uncharacterized protein YjbJ (UPF0337 family)